jgi:hypothetical protein
VISQRHTYVFFNPKALCEVAIFFELTRKLDKWLESEWLEESQIEGARYWVARDE